MSALWQLCTISAQLFAEHQVAAGSHPSYRHEEPASPNTCITLLTGGLLVRIQPEAPPSRFGGQDHLFEYLHEVHFGFTIAIGPMILFGSAFGLGRHICERSFETSVTYRFRAESTWIWWTPSN